MNEIYISLLILLIAALYSSVGHGGASSYLALLGVFGLSLIEMRSSALLLNVVVSGISFFFFYKSKYFKWKLFYPLAITSVPATYLGSMIQINPDLYKQILGFCLLLAVFRILGLFSFQSKETNRELPIYVGLLIGAVLGLVSGIIGIGGGIILTPIILIFRWGNLKETAAVSAIFILVNSLSGLIGLFQKGLVINSNLVFWVAAAVLGGIAGSIWGSQFAKSKVLKSVLAGVLFLASIKLIFV